MKASGDASAKNMQHILVVIKPDGTLALSGSHNIVHALLGDAELYTKFQITVNASRLQEGSQVDHVEIVTKFLNVAGMAGSARANFLMTCAKSG